MTAISTHTTRTVLSCRLVSPTRAERVLLRFSRAVETFALSRMMRRARGASDVADAAADRRRTAQALGALGMLPR
jgi:hypothetical protein